MKTLFLIDGAFGDAKKSLCSIVNSSELRRWHLIQKYTTKIPKDGKPLPADMIHIDRKTAEQYLDNYNINYKKRTSFLCQYYCYSYPRIEGISTEEINCIDTKLIDDAIDICDYGFLIVRSHKCMHDIIVRYEKNGQLNVVPVFLYSDDFYLKDKDEETKKKSKKLFDDFIEDREGRERINFEDILIFKSSVDNTNPQDILKIQIKQLIDRLERKNEDLFVVTESERYYLPEMIRGYKKELQAEVHSLNAVYDFRHRVFLIMPFDEKYEEHKRIIAKAANELQRESEPESYTCIRADDADDFISLVSGAKPDVAYWLKMYVCKFGIALFDADTDNKLIINANVVYEMGIMKQQGKRVCLLIPQGARLNERDKVFFDIENDWRYTYRKDDIGTIEDCVERFLRERTI